MQPKKISRKRPQTYDEKQYKVDEAKRKETARIHQRFVQEQFKDKETKQTSFEEGAQ